MIAQPTHRKLPMLITNSELKEYPDLEAYGKRDVLRYLVLYEKHNFFKTSQASWLHKARRAYGTQFLIDLFLMTEVYINHWPKYKMCEARRDIVSVLGHNPDERIRREEGKGTIHVSTTKAESKPEGKKLVGESNVQRSKGTQVDYSYL